MDYNSLQVTIIPQQAMKDLEISKDTFYRWLKVLLAKDYMRKIATNVYWLRPYSVVRGQMSKVPEPDF